jgi:hypothetical protein
MRVIVVDAQQDELIIVTAQNMEKQEITGNGPYIYRFFPGVFFMCDRLS